MKALVAKRKKLTIEGRTPEKGYFEETLKSRLIPLEFLAPSVKPKPVLQTQITGKIKKQGLKWPLLVLVNHPSLWLTPEFKCVHEDMILPYDRSKVFVTVVGNNRLYAAEDLGFDRVSCITLPNLSWLYPAQLALGSDMQPLTEEDVRIWTTTP